MVIKRNVLNDSNEAYRSYVINGLALNCGLTLFISPLSAHRNWLKLLTIIMLLR
jgi:hypothetical protein